MIHPTRSGEVLARCLEITNTYGILRRSLQDREAMRAAFREVAREVSAWNLAGTEVVELFLLPMQRRLSELFGDDACHVYWDFFDAFWLSSWCQGPTSSQRRPAAPLLRLEDGDHDPENEPPTGRISRWTGGTGRPRSRFWR